MSSRRVRFGRDVHYPVSPEYATPPSERKGVYKKARRNGPAKYYTNDSKEQAARHAHTNAARCERRDAAEAVLLLMHKLRRDAPWAWNATGAAASAEDQVREFLRRLEEPPPEPPKSWCGWLSMDKVHDVLLGCRGSSSSTTATSDYDPLYCHEKLHAD